MTDTTATATTKISLEIGGMTCASCAARIAKRLNKLDGVHEVPPGRTSSSAWSGRARPRCG